MNTLSREAPIDPVQTALLIIDVQNYCTGTGKSEYFRQSLRDIVLPYLFRASSTQALPQVSDPDRVFPPEALITVPSIDGCAPWISFGNRLFKRGATFFIRVSIPRDLRDLYAATGRRYEICETLKTRERREAEGRCRRQGAEIDQEFARRRRELASQEPVSRRVDVIAQRPYREELSDQGTALRDQMMRDPKMTEVGLDAVADPWIDGLERGAWSRKQNEFAAAALLRVGSFSALITRPFLKPAIRSPARSSGQTAPSPVRLGERASRHPIPSSRHWHHPRRAVA